MLALNNIQGEVCFFNNCIIISQKTKELRRTKSETSFLHSSLNLVHHDFLWDGERTEEIER